MPERIIRLKPEEVAKFIKQGEIKLPDDPTDPPQIESKPVETPAPIITPPVNTSLAGASTNINTLGGVPAKGVGRRRFMWGAGLAIVGVALLLDIQEGNRQETARVAEDSRQAEAARVKAAADLKAHQEADAKIKADAEAARKAGIERAEKLFGEDFLGEQAIHKMEDKCRAVGIDVKFEIPIIPFHLNISQLEAAKKDEQKGKARMVVLRPEFMTVNGERKPITLLNLRALFENTNPFGSGKIFYSLNWQDLYTEHFVQEGLQAKFALPTKKIIPGSLGKDWNDQEKLIEPGESRREAVETVWDIILYYAATGKRILENTRDWTKTQMSDGRLVLVGNFESRGLSVDRWLPSGRPESIGVCLSR